MSQSFPSNFIAAVQTIPSLRAITQAMKSDRRTVVVRSIAAHQDYSAVMAVSTDDVMLAAQDELDEEFVVIHGIAAWMAQ